MKKVLILATIEGFISSFERNDIKLLQQLNYEVHCVANFNNDSHQLDDLGIIKHHIDICRFPIKKENIKAYQALKKIMQEQHFDLVHCHTPMGGTLGRLVSKATKTQPVIYTAHGFHFFKGAPLKNWLFYYPVEKICAHYTDLLITINTEDYNFAQKHLRAKKIEYVPGVGINVEKFKNIEIDREKKRKELGASNENVILLSVGELNDNKNHSIIIQALGQIMDKNIHYYIAGLGNKKDELIALAKQVGLENNVHLLGYRKDIGELCKISDIFCFPSKREGLGLAALEAMASGLPLITSNIHGIKDYSVNKETGFSCNPKSVDDFQEAIKHLKNNPKIRIKMGMKNVKRVEHFDIKQSAKKMERIYREILHERTTS